MWRAKPPVYISYKTARQVRQFITAGGADETVPDNSIFKKQIIEALQGEADRNDDGYLTGTELGEFLEEKVVVYSREAQHPQYGKIRDPNLDKGDFVFKLKTKPAVVKPVITKPVKPKPAAGYGYLLISSYPPAKVEIDGKLYGVVPPILEVNLPTGEHSIRFFNKDLNIEETIVVDLSKGERKRVHKRFDDNK